MSRGKQVEDGITKLYKATYLDNALFNFVSGIIKIRPTFHITEAVDLFIDFMRLDYNVFTTEIGQSIYYRMLNKYLDSFKEKI